MAARIASLLPSATDTVVALGAANRLVAVSHECDLPDGMGAVPRPSQPRLDPARRSAEIDRDVRALVEEALSIYRIDADSLRAAAPDVIVTQTQCAVCAVTPRDLETALADWLGKPPLVVALSPNSLTDAFVDMRRIADTIGMGEAGRVLVGHLLAQLDGLATRAAQRRMRPRIAVIEWLDPLMGAGNWMPELVRLANAEPLFGKAGEHTPFIAFADLAAADPDAIVVAPCGFSIDQTMRELPSLLAQPDWQSLGAVRNGRLLVADGNRFFNRPGPSLVGTLEILVEAACGTAPHGIGWQRLAGRVAA